MRDGVTTDFKLAKFDVGGSVRLYVEEKKVWVGARVAAKGKTHQVNVGLVPLP